MKKEYAKAVSAGLDMLERANQLDKTANDLRPEVINSTNTQDLRDYAVFIFASAGLESCVLGMKSCLDNQKSTRRFKTGVKPSAVRGIPSYVTYVYLVRLI
mgnify:CR=1 FL=1